MVFQEKEALEEMLQQSQESLEESKSYIGQLRSQQKDEKRERARYVEAVYEFVTRNCHTEMIPMRVHIILDALPIKVMLKVLL